MTITNQKKWTLATVLGLAYWFFADFHEAIIFSPNWVVDSPAQMKRLNEFFIYTSPTIYFVPVVIFTIATLWFLSFANKLDEVKREYRMGSIFVLAATIITVFFVVLILPNMFGNGLYQKPDDVKTYAWIWNILNIVRVGLVVTTTYYLFNAYRKLDKMVENYH